MTTITFSIAALAIGVVIGPAPASAASAGASSDCFDAIVTATILRQTPTVVPEIEDEIVTHWPWVLELNVERVIEGTVDSSPLTVLTVQHTYYRTDLGSRQWWLRRNTLGALNVIRPKDAARLRRCPPGTSPAAPYIQPSNGRTLADEVREGEERYGRRP